MQIGEWNIEGKGGLLERCPWWQLKKWFDYHELDPWGEERADLRSGIIASILANVNRDPKRTKPFSPSDFMPYAEGKRQVETTPMTEQEWSDFKLMMIASGKRIDH